MNYFIISAITVISEGGVRNSVRLQIKIISNTSKDNQVAGRFTIVHRAVSLFIKVTDINTFVTFSGISVPQSFCYDCEFVSLNSGCLCACVYVFKNSGIFFGLVLIYANLESALSFANINFSTVARVFIDKVV